MHGVKLSTCPRYSIQPHFDIHDRLLTHRLHAISRGSSPYETTGNDRSARPSQHNIMLQAAQKLSQRLRIAIIAESEEREREVMSVYTGLTEKQLIRDGLILVALTASPQGRLYDELIFKLESDRPLPSEHKFKAGRTIRIEKMQTSSSFYVEATVLDAFPTHILVTLPATQQTDRNKNGNSSSGASSLLASKANSLQVRLHPQDITTERQLQSVDKLIDFSSFSSQSPTSSHVQNSSTIASGRGEALVRAVLLGSHKGSVLAEEPPEWMNDSALQQRARRALQEIKTLNPSQKTAIAAALTRTFTLWQGPPGTGKTKTVVAYLKVLCATMATTPSSSSSFYQLRRRLFPILAVAETNNAADNLLEGLHAAGIAAVRIGQPVRIRPSLRMCSLEHLAEASPSGQQAAFLRDSATNMLMKADKAFQHKIIRRQQVEESQREGRLLWSQAREQVLEAEQEVLRSCDVVVATCSGVGDPRLSGRKFPLVVIDESTQATEAATLVPLVLGAESVVMAGDPEQLWPIVMSQKAVECQLDVPLFARLQQQCNMPALLLNTQYRMHPVLSKFSSIAFYKGKVVDGVTEKDRPMVSLSSKENSCVSSVSSPLVFVNIPGKEQRAGVGAAALLNGENASFSNQRQADAAFDIVQQVMQDKTVESCALLTPYNGQVKLLTSMMKKRPSMRHAVDSGRLIINTVDGFQGREADCVVLSTVRCNTRGRLGFVAEKRRMNVALTRARRALIVLGCQKTLQSNEYWAAWLKLAQQIDFPLEEP